LYSRGGVEVQETHIIERAVCKISEVLVDPSYFDDIVFFSHS